MTYDVYRGTTSASISTRLAKGLTMTRYLDMSTAAGTTYYYQVTAIGASGVESVRSAVFTMKA